MSARNRTKTLLTLAAVAMVILTTTHQVSAATLTLEEPVEISFHKSEFNISVYPGNASYSGSWVIDEIVYESAGVFGDGTVLGYCFFNSNESVFSSYAADDGIVAPATATDIHTKSESWANVWTTTDPRGFADVTIYVICGGLKNDLSLTLTMSGAGQTDIQAEYSVNPGSLNRFWVVPFDFSDTGGYDTIAYTYIFATGANTRRGRFVGVIVDGAIANPERASSSSPADGATEVCRKPVLSWTPGDGAISHNVYFGSDPDNWDQQSLGQSAASYDPGPLELGAVYFWQVDENDGATTHTGDLWQFTVEPLSYEIPGASIIATADSNDPDQGPDKTIDRSGLDEADLHSAETTDMWVSAEGGVGDPWIQYEFDREYKLDKLLVWNHNSPLESIVGLGIKDALIEYSTDGQTWQSLGGAVQLDRAPGTGGYGGGTPVDLGGIVAKYVKITAQSNWGGIVRAAGLSEVRFFYVPMRARTPEPADETTQVAYNATLSWVPGRDAVSHDVYLSTNRKAVVDGSVAAVSIAADDVCGASYSPELALGQTCYWKVDEFDGAKTWDGDVWKFSTEEYLVVDDMTSYGDVDEMGVPNSRAWFTWRDGEGWLTPDHPAKGGNGTGSVVDRYTPESYETPQSLWYSYDNDGRNYFGTSNRQFYSEVTANISDLPIGGDWTAAGIKSMSIYFYGDANNIATEQLYVKLNGAKVLYDGDMAHIAEASWHEWNIDLSLFGIDLQNVTQISLGFGDENNTVARDARGTVYFDDIRLHPARCIPSLLELSQSDLNGDCRTDHIDLEIVANQWLTDGHLVTPAADPGIAGLQGRYEFEGNTNDSSGNARNGTPEGGPIFAAGQTGQALVLDGVDDYVNIDGYKGILADAGGVQQPFTLCAWIKATSDGDIITWGTNSGGQRMTLRVDTVLRVEHGSGNVRGTNGPDLRDDEWHHVAATIPQGAAIMDVRLYVDGHDVTPASTTTALFNLQPDLDVRIGMGGPTGDRFLTGLVDDARIYDRVLTREEVASLAGITEPFSVSFDLDVDGEVNFMDIAILGETWGDEILWP